MKDTIDTVDEVLDEAAETFSEPYIGSRSVKAAFIAGAKWQASQLPDKKGANKEINKIANTLWNKWALNHKVYNNFWVKTPIPLG